MAHKKKKDGKNRASGVAASSSSSSSSSTFSADTDTDTDTPPYDDGVTPLGDFQGFHATTGRVSPGAGEAVSQSRFRAESGMGEMDIRKALQGVSAEMYNSGEISYEHKGGKFYILFPANLKAAMVGKLYEDLGQPTKTKKNGRTSTLQLGRRKR